MYVCMYVCMYLSIYVCLCKHMKLSISTSALNVLQLPIVDIDTVLYVACKYFFALSLDSLFLLYILFASSANEKT